MDFRMVKIFLISGDLSKSKVKVESPKKLRNTFIPVYKMILGDCDINFVFISSYIHEQFTLKAHPALFEGEGRRIQKMRDYTIPVYNRHTHSKRSFIPVYS